MGERGPDSKMQATEAQPKTPDESSSTVQNTSQVASGPVKVGEEAGAQHVSMVDILDDVISVGADTFNREDIKDLTALTNVLEFATAAFTQTAEFIASPTRIVQDTISETAQFMMNAVLTADIPAKADDYKAKAIANGLSDGAKYEQMEKTISQQFLRVMNDPLAIATTQAYTFTEQALAPIAGKVREYISVAANSKYSWTVGSELLKADFGVVAKLRDERVNTPGDSISTVAYENGLPEKDKSQVERAA